MLDVIDLDPLRHFGLSTKHLLLVLMERESVQENICMGKLGVYGITKAIGWMGDQVAGHILKTISNKFRMAITQSQQFMDEGGCL